MQNRNVLSRVKIMFQTGPLFFTPDSYINAISFTFVRKKVNLKHRIELYLEKIKFLIKKCFDSTIVVTTIHSEKVRSWLNLNFTTIFSVWHCDWNSSISCTGTVNPDPLPAPPRQDRRWCHAGSDRRGGDVMRALRLCATMIVNISCVYEVDGPPLGPPFGI